MTKDVPVKQPVWFSKYGPSFCVCLNVIIACQSEENKAVYVGYSIYGPTSSAGFPLLLPTGSEEREYWGFGLFLLQYFLLVNI